MRTPSSASARHFGSRRRSCSITKNRCAKSVAPEMRGWGLGKTRDPSVSGVPQPRAPNPYSHSLFGPFLGRKSSSSSSTSSSSRSSSSSSSSKSSSSSLSSSNSPNSSSTSSLLRLSDQ